MEHWIWVSNSEQVATCFKLSFFIYTFSMSQSCYEEHEMYVIHAQELHILKKEH